MNAGPLLRAHAAESRREERAQRLRFTKNRIGQYVSADGRVVLTQVPRGYVVKVDGKRAGSVQRIRDAAAYAPKAV